LTAIFLAFALLFVIVFLMMGFVSLSSRGSNTFLYFALAAISLLLLFMVLFFSASLETHAFIYFCPK
jgi:uncharacterized membrane protein YhdT